MSYLTVVRTAKVLFFTFYSLSGFWKGGTDGVQDLFAGLEGNFAPRGFALQLADRIVQTNTTPLLADIAIRNYWLGWPAFLVLIYAQFFALVAVFRPRLHVLWGYLIIGFHVGTGLLMDIFFQQHVMRCYLFVPLPFRPLQWSLPGRRRGLAPDRHPFPTGWTDRAGSFETRRGLANHTRNPLRSAPACEWRPTLEGP